MLNNKGFTLIESVFVLAIVIVTSSLLMMLHSYHIDNEIIIEQIKQNIYSAKMNAMIYKEKTYLLFNENELIIESEHFNKTLQLKNTTMEKGKYSYNKKGHINEGGHIDFKINNQSYKIIFHLGSGYFEIE